MNERFDEEQYNEVQLRLCELYNKFFNDVSEEELRRREVMNAEFIEGFEESVGGPPSAQRLSDARQMEKEHRAALARYRKGHRTRYPGSDELQVDAFWGDAIPDLLEAYLLHRDNPADGGLWAFADHMHDALFDYQLYGHPAAVEDEMVARTIVAIRGVYKRVLGRSDRGPQLKGEAAKLTPEERDIQADEIARSLGGLGIDLTDPARRSRLVDDLITSADEIRFYPVPEEEDGDEDHGRGCKYRSPAQAAAQNVGKILPELLRALGLYVEGVRLRPTAPLGERSMMGRMAAAKRRNLQSFDPTSLVMAAVDAVLRNELEGELFKEAMIEVKDVVTSKLEAQRRMNEERDSNAAGAVPVESRQSGESESSNESDRVKASRVLSIA